MPKPRLFPVFVILLFVSLVSAVRPGFADEGRGAWLGVVLGDAVDGGARIIALVPGGPAELAGLAVGDVLLRADDQPIGGRATLAPILAERSAGQPFVVTVARDGQRVETKVLLGNRTRAPRALPEPPALPQPPRMAFGVASTGLGLTDLTSALRVHYGAPADVGVLVTRVEQGYPVDAAGVRVGDLVVGVGDEKVSRAADVSRLLGVWRAAADSDLALQIVRDGRGQRLSLDREVVLERLVDVERRVRGEQREARLREEIRALEGRLERLRQELEALGRSGSTR